MNLPPTFPLSMAAEHTPVRVVSIKALPILPSASPKWGSTPAQKSACASAAAAAFW